MGDVPKLEYMFIFVHNTNIANKNKNKLKFMQTYLDMTEECNIVTQNTDFNALK